ncbi:agamous-like MADS-box protein AGL14 isoform X2 [Syzygium oleosum]|uniref:agamous-like MADS-box protein AGL14 isoform X2 n=1 Tax=Syzygium oleosum TaxID=219896 RepID=UPI0011D27ED5|nr:agamous-like MADS-box protein AGL14 isoform X2 [Syzygium oleosum]
MVRGKTQMKRIENDTSRQVTFSKRRNGLLKKAFELSVLCDAEVALIIFSPRGKLYEFSSSSLSKTIEKYQKKAKDMGSKTAEIPMQLSKGNTLDMEKKIEHFEVCRRRLLGEGLDSCSIEELQQTENQLERSLTKIRARKNHLIKEQIERLKAEERKLLEEKRKLLEEIECGRGLTPVSREPPREEIRTETMDVETELFIGPPKR